ncbi:L-seryl-tRNA(Ser) seleniumtransferase, partial [Candidatus Electrothrix marina]
MTHMQNILRLIPSVDDFLLALLQDSEFENIPLMLLKKGVRVVLDNQRRRVLEGHKVEPSDLELSVLLEKIQLKIRELDQPAFRRVINGTGVIIHQ